MYEIHYYYDDEWAGTVSQTETFEGSWDELQDYVQELRASGCYDIIAAHVWDPVRDGEEDGRC